MPFTARCVLFWRMKLEGCSMDNALHYRKKLLLPVFATAVVIAFCLRCYGSYYEEYQSLFLAFLSQALSPGTLFESWYYQSYIAIGALYARLYRHFPGVEWISWLSFLYMFVAGCGIGYVFTQTLKQAGNLLLAAVLLPVAFLLLADSILHFQNARVAYLICGSTLLISIFCFYEPSFIRKNRFAFLAINVFYLLGCLSRSEPGMGMLFLFIPFSLLWHRSLRKTLLAVALPLSISAGILFYILIDRNLTDEFHKRIEPDVEMQLTVRRNVVPLSAMKTAADSMKYEAALNMLWGDPRVLDEKFLRSLIEDAPYLSISWKQVARALTYCAEYTREYAHLLLFSFLFLLFASAWLYRKNGKLYALMPLGYFLVFFLAIFVQTYYVKMRPWSFSPYAALLLVSAALYFFKTADSRRFFYAGLFLLLLAGIFHHRFVQAGSITEKKIYAYNRALYDSVKKIAKDETLLLNPTSYQSFLSASRPFEVFDYSDFHKLFFYESQLGSVLPGYREYLMKECSCDVFDFSQFYKYLSDEKYPRTVYALSAQGRMRLIQQYLLIIHGFRLEYEEVPGVHLPVLQREFQEPLRLYVLKKHSGKE